MTNRAPLLRISAAVLPALHRAIGEGRDAAEAARLARQFGFESGSAFYEALAQWSADEAGAALDDLAPERFWEMVATFFSTLGWGEMSFKRLHPGLAVLQSHDWAESQPDGAARYPSCHVTTGILAELLRRVAGTDLAVLEVGCHSQGDELCRFVIGGAETLEEVYQQIRNGASLEKAIEQL
jgi:predicted hydrocarbon binding protein